MPTSFPCATSCALRHSGIGQPALRVSSAMRPPGHARAADVVPSMVSTGLHRLRNRTKEYAEATTAVPAPQDAQGSRLTIREFRLRCVADLISFRASAGRPQGWRTTCVRLGHRGRLVTGELFQLSMTQPLLVFVSSVLPGARGQSSESCGAACPSALGHGISQNLSGAGTGSNAAPTRGRRIRHLASRHPSVGGTVRSRTPGYARTTHADQPL